MTEEKLDLTGLGYAEFEWSDLNGKARNARWKRPNLRIYRERRNHLEEIGKQTNEIRTRRNQLLAWLAHAEEGADLPEDSEPLPEEFDADAAWSEVEEIRDKIADYIEPWMVETNEQLGNPPLPDDIDEWPPWALNPQIASDILAHWRKVPLAPGSKGTNNPREPKS